MLIRIFTLLLSLSVFTVQANGHHAELENIFKDLNIALQVEWDQTNQDQYQEITKAFQLKLEELQKSGLTNKELIDFTVGQVVNKNVGVELKSIYSKIEADKLSAKEAREIVLKHMSKFHSEGSSWVGRGTYITIAAVVAVVALAAVIAAASGGGTVYVGSGGGYYSSCYDEYVCYDYYDYYYNWWYTDCYWQTYCY